MKNKVEIISRKTAKNLIKTGFPENAAVICFYDPGDLPVDYSAVCKNVFNIPVHDIDIAILGDYGLDFDSYFPEAEKLAEFIADAINNGFDIICQCEYGQSRSAACAAAILEVFNKSGIEIFADYRYYPNQLIFNKLRNALLKKAKKQ